MGGGEIFRTCPDRPCVPPSLLYNAYRVFPGGKAALAWLWPLTLSSTEAQERVELCLYSISVPSWSVIGWSLPLPLILSVLTLKSSGIWPCFVMRGVTDVSDPHTASSSPNVSELYSKKTQVLVVTLWEC